MLVGHRPADGQEAAREIRAVLFQFLDVWQQLVSVQREQRGVVEQRAVNATDVRPLHMNIFISTRAQRLLCHEVIEHARVLHLRQAYDRTAHVGQHVGAHVSEGARHVAQFVLIFHLPPSVCPVGQVFVVVLPLVVACVKQVLLVVEADTIDTELFLPVCEDRRETEQKDQYFSHNFILFLFVRTCISEFGDKVNKKSSYTTNPE